MPPMEVKLEQSGPNEVFSRDGSPRELYRPVLDELERMGVEEWERRVGRARERYLVEQHGFGILGGDKRHPTDWFPRLLSAANWEVLERGLAQRLLAVNEFLRRLEAGKEEVVPRESLETSALYDTSIPNRFGEVPARQMGIDLVALEGEGDGSWRYRIIEDNARMPVGAARCCGRPLHSPIRRSPSSRPAPKTSTISTTTSSPKRRPPSSPSGTRSRLTVEAIWYTRRRGGG